MSKKKKNIIAACLFLILLASFIICASRVVMPKRYELGANWGAFRAEEQDSLDVVFFGSSLVYCNVIPATIWEDSGLSSYVMAGPEQTAAVTYYYVEEMFRSQSPSAVLVEASCIHYNAWTGQDTIKVNLGYMPYDLTRLKATFQAAPREQWLGLLFPLYNYHDRWSSLTADDIRLGLLGYGPDQLHGYNYLDQAEVQEAPRQRSFQQNQWEYAAQLKWLQRIAALCEEKGSRCIFYVSGSYAYFEPGYLAQMREDLTAAHGAEFIDCMADIEQMGLDPNTDFFDILHFNYRGAEKYSHYLSGKLTELGVTARQPYADAQRWQEDIAYLGEMINQSESR